MATPEHHRVTTTEAAADGAPVLAIGQHSDRGRKRVNQDFHGVARPDGAPRATKGVVVALADGIGSSDVSQVAAEFAVMALLDDYYCTSDAWTVKKSVERVVAATNAWLHSRTRDSVHRFDQDKGYVCTLSALVFKGSTVHVFHVGDARIHRVHAQSLEPLTQDHRVQVAGGQSHLARAVGFRPQVEIDYLALPVAPGDTFLLTTDGVHGHVDEAFLAQAVAEGRDDLDATARHIADEALRRGSDDNVTVQVVVVQAVPPADVEHVRRQAAELPAPPQLEARQRIDGYEVMRVLHRSHRSHLYVVRDTASPDAAVACLKAPSTELQADPAARERFLMEEWIARRLDSPHVLRPCAPRRPRSHLYLTTEYVDGQTLRQWMTDHPRPSLDQVRGIVEQVARGLQAFHRLEMLHQDLRPENVMIDRGGTVKIIDFGTVRVAGLAELSAPVDRVDVPGALQYMAPEYFLGEPAGFGADLFSLAVIAYEMLSGRLPYGLEVPRARSVAAQRRLRCDPVTDDDREVPAWVDGALRQALSPDPRRRHESLSAFVHDLRHPNPAFAGRARPPLAERHPVRFWQAVSLALGLVVLALLLRLFGTG